MSRPLRREFPRKLSARRRFKLGLKRHFSLNHTYGKNITHRRFRYRNMVWKKAPTLYIIFVVSLVIIFILIDLIGFQPDAFLVMLFLGLLIIASIIEIWYVGGD